MSFDSLPSENDKELFKHIACFFVGKDRDYTETILEACNINTRWGIRNLVDRCLLSIGWCNELRMHQLLQEMGRDEVRKESPKKPWKRSRLWSHEESYKVLIKQKKDMENILGLTLDTRVLEKEKLGGSFEVKTDVLSKMHNIMLLQLNYVQIKGTCKNFPKELRWLCMHGFPLKSIPSDLPLDNLVALDMSYSNIESLFGMYWSNPQQLEDGQKMIGSSSKDKRILGSLKILDLSFYEQLHKLDGFYELPTLERLILRNCKLLIEICESLEECVELVHIDLSYCVKLEKLPTAIHKLKKDCKLLLDGCNTRESILLQLVPPTISSPNSLVSLSLANNNLSNESFPMDLSCLSRLKHLCLDGNPIVSMPSFVRSLCSLEELSMNKCITLMSIEHPPCTLKRLDINLGYPDEAPLLQRISFDPDMSPISIHVNQYSFQPWSFEIEGMLKIQPLGGVEEKVLCSLGWTNLSDFLNKSHVVTSYSYRGAEQYQIQMYYEFGIFSTFYGGQAMPDWISWSISSQTPFISFTIPSSPNKQLRGLNFYCVQRTSGRAYRVGPSFYVPKIEISNKTKNRTWIYRHFIWKIDVGGEGLTFISHWMFGMNEMEAGDQIIIALNEDEWASDQTTRSCGVGFVYEDEDGSMEEEEEDALEYYKSWNHIIGGDLSSFETTTTGEYLLSHPVFTDTYRIKEVFKEENALFRAFSKRKSHKFPPNGAKRQRLLA